MRALLDTGALLGWMSEPSRFDEGLLDELTQTDSIVLYSQISLWEIQIKIGIGKLALKFPLDQMPRMAEESGLTLLPLSNEAIFTLPKLPDVHRDPFDRLLICEAIQQGVPLVTPDAIIRSYPVRVLW